MKKTLTKAPGVVALWARPNLLLLNNSAACSEPSALMKKKLYYIESFSKETGEIRSEDAKSSASKNKAVKAAPIPSKENAGAVINWYSTADMALRHFTAPEQLCKN